MVYNILTINYFLNSNKRYKKKMDKTNLNISSLSNFNNLNEPKVKLVQPKFQYFPFHLVDPSPWPILLSFSLLNLTVGAVSYMHGFNYGGYILTIGFTLT